MTVGRNWATRIGERVVVRRRRAESHLADVVGLLVAVDSALHVDTRRGRVTIPLDEVLAGKVIPPKPVRRAPPHLAVSITDLQGVMSRHWRSLESERFGGWLLRASAGFTGRGNSMLPLGEPRTEPAHALAFVAAWYAERRLPPKASIAGQADGGVPNDHGPAEPAGAACLAAGWHPVHDASALVMTAPTGQLRRPVVLPTGLAVDVATEPDQGWLDGYRYRGQNLPAAALQLLVSAPQQCFISVRDGARTVAVARGSLGGGWAGLTAVEVSAEYRGQGVAGALLAAAAEWAWQAGAGSTYLQVAESNAVALRLYQRGGFIVHHRYDYLQAPDA
jgi:GNAT superfamily N-acetyltransferase